jgi:hypothetical protein
MELITESGGRSADAYLLKVVEEYGDAQKYPNPPTSNVTKL